jgi:hypothetical protein
MVLHGEAFPDFAAAQSGLHILATTYGVICLSSPISKNIFVFI